MPRSKYLAVFFIAFALPIVGGALNALPEHNSSERLLQQATLIASLQEEPEVLVMRDTTREETRTSLIEKLREYVEPESERTVVMEIPIPVVEETSTEALSRAFMCADGRVSGSGVASWGKVNITLAEGARMVTSAALSDTGIPLRTLQLSASPPTTGTQECLPQGMVGIALDGRVIMANVPFSAHAEGIAGYAIDGLGIFNTYENGAKVSSDMLDACHGHVHAIVWDGVLTLMYHYHITEDAPYSLGCFRGVPATID